MKIRISEVWNYKGESKELVVIEADKNPQQAVWDWIGANRPDLDMACGIQAHGFHAVGIN